MAEDFVKDRQVQEWLDAVEPAWTLLTFESLRALRQEPSAVQRAVRLANDLGADEIASSPVARNTLIALARGGRAGRPSADGNRQPDEGHGRGNVQVLGMARL